MEGVEQWGSVWRVWVCGDRCGECGGANGGWVQWVMVVVEVPIVVVSMMGGFVVKECFGDGGANGRWV